MTNNLKPCPKGQVWRVFDARVVFAAQTAIALAAITGAGWIAGTQVPSEVELISAMRGQADQACAQAVNALQATAKPDGGRLVVTGRSAQGLREAALEVSLLQTQCAGHELVSACLGAACDNGQGAGYAVVLAPRKLAKSGR